MKRVSDIRVGDTVKNFPEMRDNMTAMDKKRIITLVATMSTCALLELEKYIPTLTSNSAISRAVVKAEEAIINLARISGGVIIEEDIELGIKAHNAGMEIISEGLMEKII